MSNPTAVEICVDSVTSAVNAEKGGATRIELCQSLAEGGLTPSIGLLKKAKMLLSIPVFVLIRPRGGDFCYSPLEVQVMEEDVASAVQHGADGIVIGALTEMGEVDVDICMKLIGQAGRLPVTFHRAFDLTLDPSKALETVISLGCQRVLTSGQATDALQGLPLISELMLQAQGRTIIMPGAGINEMNLEEILRTSGAREFHSSASSYITSAMTTRRGDVKMGAASSEFRWKECDQEKVQKMITIAKNVWGK